MSLRCALKLTCRWIACQSDLTWIFAANGAESRKDLPKLNEIVRAKVESTHPCPASDVGHEYETVNELVTQESDISRFVFHRLKVANNVENSGVSVYCGGLFFCCLRHSARASSNCNTKVGSGGLPIFAVGETIYRATLPNSRSFLVGHLSQPRMQRINVQLFARRQKVSGCRCRSV